MCPTLRIHLFLVYSFCLLAHLSCRDDLAIRGISLASHLPSPCTNLLFCMENSQLSKYTGSLCIISLPWNFQWALVGSIKLNNSWRWGQMAYSHSAFCIFNIHRSSTESSIIILSLRRQASLFIYHLPALAKALRVVYSINYVSEPKKLNQLMPLTKLALEVMGPYWWTLGSEPRSVEPYGAILTWS